MSNALAVYDGGRFDVMQRASRALLESGYFSDTKSLAQVVVKVMAGAELGISPFASVSGIHIIQGKPALSSNLIAALVKNDPRYNYRVKQATDDGCILTWYEDGEEVGTSSFTMKEAQAAGLTGKSTWKQYPSDMLFARALTRGARRHAPGIFGGAPVYTADELGADEAPDGYVEPSQIPTIVVHQAEPEPTDNGNGPEPEPAGEVLTLRDQLAKLPKMTAAQVAEKAAESGAYDHKDHALNALKQHAAYTTVGVGTAMGLDWFDWLMARKADAEA